MHNLLPRAAHPAPRPRGPFPAPTPARGAPPASRSALPSWPWSAQAAGRSPACAARGCCAGAIARRRPRSCCWRRPTCAGATPALPTRPPPAASASPALSPTSTAARRSRSSPRAPPGRASCTASAGCATSRRRTRAKRGPWPSSSSASGSRTAAGRRCARLGARGRWPPRLSWLSHAGVLLDGAEPKRYAAIMASLDRPGHLPRRLLAQCAGWLSSPPRPDRPRPRRPLHRRP